MEFKVRKQDDQKDTISITIDRNLNYNLHELKKKKKMRRLSPTINHLLWEWMKTLIDEDVDKVVEINTEINNDLKDSPAKNNPSSSTITSENDNK